LIGIFKRSKVKTSGLLLALLDQAGVYRSSLYETGKVHCRELFHFMILGGPETVSKEEECGDEKKRVMSYRMASIRSEAAPSLHEPRQIWSLFHEPIENGSFRNGT